MAEADWTDLASGLGTGDVRRGVSAGFTPPYDSPVVNTMVHGYRTLTSVTGFAGKYYTASGFNPITGTCKGGHIQMAMKRYSSAVGYAPLMGLIVGSAATGQGYFVGLSDEDSFKICLKKGVPTTGLDSTESSILRASTASYALTGDDLASWFHLRLEVLVNPHGETILSVKKNDLSVNPVSSPDWVAIPGMDDYIDDSLGVHSESVPLTDGFYLFYGHYAEQTIGAVSLFDHVELSAQTNP